MNKKDTIENKVAVSASRPMICSACADRENAEWRIVLDIEETISRIRHLKNSPFLTDGEQQIYIQCEKMFEETLSHWK